MKTTLISIIAALAALGLLVGALLLYIAARIALAAVLFFLFAGIVVWAIVRHLRGPAVPQD
ncbi:hypothetical protein [Dongia sedimenti]|uniref:Uncharacterized protein n=1 Tax=Dongia sedimenti TaxID=3064282 RepID=A0ABU0YTV4_9PROT|nr:hypothetical protein [Rhodospirillaceae bacterium R-7]